MRARNLEKHLLWAQLLTPLVVERLDGPHRPLRAEALVQASLACFDLALASWAQSETAADPARLLRAAFAEIASISQPAAAD
ncbi:hypothetical protein [Microterricola gilva]|uniref:hypothetical protein n=1 Tax=Microterricola gilva TaxID=393267 RepID=UPI001A93965C